YKRLRHPAVDPQVRQLVSTTSLQRLNPKSNQKNRFSNLCLSRKPFRSTNRWPLRRCQLQHLYSAKRPRYRLETRSTSIRSTSPTRNRPRGKRRKRSPKDQQRPQNKKSCNLSPSPAVVLKKASRRSSKAKTSMCRLTFEKTSR